MPMNADELPVAPHFDPQAVEKVWRVPYQDRAAGALRWARDHAIAPAARDVFRICLVLVDVQNTFCIPEFELFVAGRSGMGAVEDNRRLCAFVYRNLHRITRVCPTLDTHTALQIFHPIFLADPDGNPPAPFTVVTVDDVERGKWRFNAAIGPAVGAGLDPEAGQRHLLHYCRRLKEGGKYDLTVWPYHAMLGGIGHALVSAVEEAVFFHGIARACQPDFQVKGSHPLTENYSAVRPEVTEDAQGRPLAEKNPRFLQLLRSFDAVLVAGQAKSHCVAWTMEDLLRDIPEEQRHLAGRIYLLQDCTSPVVIPGVVDYTEAADEAFRRFAGAGVNLVASTEPMDSWPGFGERVKGCGTP